MKPRMIDANYLIAEFTDRALKARQWKEGAILNGNEEAAIRADAVLAFLVEVKAAIENAPTLNDKTYAIGYAAGSREGYKKGIEDARPTGEWKQDINGWHVCSNCHMIYKGMPTINRNPRWLYCPTCGARMKKEGSR